MKLASKLTLGSICIGIATTLVAMSIIQSQLKPISEDFQNEYHQRILAQLKQHMQSTIAITANEVKQYLQNVHDKVSTLAVAPSTHEAFLGFRDGVAQLPDEIEDWDGFIASARTRLHAFYHDELLPYYQSITPGANPDWEERHQELDERSIALQDAYIVGNKYPIGKKHLLEQATGDHIYHAFHAQFHSHFVDICNRYGFYDIFLINADDGRIVYSAFKERDFATSLWDGPQQDSKLVVRVKQSATYPVGPWLV